MVRRVLGVLVLLAIVLLAVVLPADRGTGPQPEPAPATELAPDPPVADPDLEPEPPGPPGPPPPPPGEGGPPGGRPPMPPAWRLTLKGTLVNFAGEPIPRARVDFRALRGAHGGDYKTLTDGEGRFSFRHLPAGTYFVSHDPHGAWTVERRVRVVTGEETVCLRMPPGRELVVTLMDEAGRPVAGAEIRVFDHQGSRMHMPTGPTGTMKFTLTRGFLRARAQRGGMPGKPPLLPASSTRLPPEGTPLILVLREAGSITGRVVMPSGEAVADLVVTAFEEGEPGETANTGDDGRFSIRAPRGGIVDLVIDGLQGHPWDRPRTEIFATARVEDVAVGTRELVVVLEPAARNRVLTVRLRSPDGEPMPGARARILSGAARQALASGEADDKGVVQLTGLPSIPVFLEAEDPLAGRRTARWFAPRALRIVPDGQVEDLRFRRPLTLVGRVVDRSGNPPGECVLVATEAREEKVAEGKTGKDGRFRLEIPEDVKLPLSIRALRAWYHEVPNRGCLRLDALGGDRVRIRLDGNY